MEMKRFLALLAALTLLLCSLPVLAEDWDDDDDWGDDSGWGDDGDWDDGDDWGDEDDSEQVVNDVKGRMNTLSGYSQENPQEGDFIYAPLEDGVSCQTLRYVKTSEEVTVPETLGGLVVAAIGSNTFANNTTVEKVILPETVEMIDNMAFFKCDHLKEVVLPKSLEMLGRCCFGGCTALASIELPANLKVVDEFVFLQCIELRELSFTESLLEVGPNAFCLCMNLEKVTLPTKASVDETAFAQCKPDLKITYLE